MLEKILSRMHELGMKQGRLEQLAGLSENRISKWKDGKGEITATQAFRIARSLNLPLDYLLDDALTDPTPTLSDEDRAVLRLYRILKLGGDGVVERLIGGETQAAPAALEQPGPHRTVESVESNLRPRPPEPESQPERPRRRGSKPA